MFELAIGAKIPTCSP